MEQKPESEKFNVDNIPGKFYSIPESDGSFRLERGENNSEGSLYKIDKDGNVYLVNRDLIKRAFNRLDSYLQPVWDYDNYESYKLMDEAKAEGIIVKKIAKIDKNTGKLIQKGELQFTTEKGIFYELGEEKEIERETISDYIENKESIRHVYAEFIENGKFRSVTNAEADFSIFELTLLTPNRATFKISPNREKLVIARPNYLAGCIKDIESDGKYLITKNVGTAHKSSFGEWIIDSELEVKITKTEPNETEKIAPEISKTTESVIEVKDEKLEKQKKIDEIYRDIMEMINRNTESLLKEKKLEDELAQLIASEPKKEAVNEPAKKIETKPFSFNINLIKQEIEKLILGNKKIKKLNKFKIDGVKDKIIMNLNVEATKKTFLGNVSVNVEINAIVQNENNKIVIKNPEIEAGVFTSFVKDEIEPELGKVFDLIKEYIEKKVNKKVEKIWIENGELKAL